MIGKYKIDTLLYQYPLETFFVFSVSGNLTICPISSPLNIYVSVDQRSPEFPNLKLINYEVHSVCNIEFHRLLLWAVHYNTQPKVYNSIGTLLKYWKVDWTCANPFIKVVFKCFIFITTILEDWKFPDA